MVLNQLFENLPLCIIDGYYPKNIDNISGTQFCFYMDMLMTCVIPKNNDRSTVVLTFLHSFFWPDTMNL
jgi:hypothetical protein